MKQVSILTGSAIRHTFVRKAVALCPDIEVQRTFCEETRHNLPGVIVDSEVGAELQREHLIARERSEMDFFGAFTSLTPDQSRPKEIPFGEANSKEVLAELEKLAPDILVAYGCSLIKKPLLNLFEGRFLNVHLGLSPYYRGCGTNFWPLVNRQPELVGCTFMHIDAGIDTGEIIHQIRARYYPGDTPHQIGNRLICDMVVVYIDIIRNFEHLRRMDQPDDVQGGRLYRRKDFSPQATIQLYENFRSGIVEEYLSRLSERKASTPIVTNPAVTRAS